MAESIESFVAKLQSEGVQAGEEAAAKIRTAAQEQAEQIVQEARQQAEKIITDAQTEAESTWAKSQNELKLAARDAAMRLRDTLTKALRMVLVGPIEEQLGCSRFRELTRRLYKKRIILNTYTNLHVSLPGEAGTGWGTLVRSIHHTRPDMDGQPRRLWRRLSATWPAGSCV